MNDADLVQLAREKGIDPGVAAHYAPMAQLVDALIEARLGTTLENFVGDAVAALRKANGHQRGGVVEGTPPVLVRGLDPHARYSRKTLAARWDYSVETVRKIAAANLPPAPRMRGESERSEVRYLGADVLRYEGVSEEEISGAGPPPNVVALRPPDRTATLQPMPTTRRGRRSLGGHLPTLET